MYGLEAVCLPRFASGRDVLGVLTDNKRSETFFGEPIFFQTRSGIRYRDPGIQTVLTGENHRDFCLATFAELGLPLSTPMTAADGSFTLRDLLRDSVENFSIKQNELPWTAIAYAIYLVPQRGWTNRYRESFTLDDLANALMGVPLHQVSCGGGHLLTALTVLWRVDSSTRCLSESVREALTQYLRKRVTALVESQHKQGFWSIDWHVEAPAKAEVKRLLPPDTAHSRLIATGHLLEWLELLPVELQPAPEVYRRAGRWLGPAMLERFPVKSLEDFCPSVHAVCAVRRLIGEASE